MFDSESLSTRRRSRKDGDLDEYYEKRRTYSRRPVREDEYYDVRRPRRRSEEYDDYDEPDERTQVEEYEDDERIAIQPSKKEPEYDDREEREDLHDEAEERPVRLERPERNSRVYRSERGQREKRRVRSEDSFLEQMNTFKERARQLQDLINEKQDQVDYLEDMLDDLEEQNQRLKDELKKSREHTGDYAIDIEEQVERLSEVLGADLDEMEQRISSQIESIPAPQGGEMQEITFDTESITAGFDEQQKRMDETFASICERLEDIIEGQKKLLEVKPDAASDEKLDTIISNQEKIIENQGGEDAKSTRDQLNEIFSDQKSFFSNSMLTQEKKLTESLNGMDSKLEGMKNELSDKIHSEDVKVYRNLQDYIKEQDHHEEDNRLLISRYKALRNREYINMVLTAINIILGAFFLYIIS